MDIFLPSRILPVKISVKILHYHDMRFRVRAYRLFLVPRSRVAFAEKKGCNSRGEMVIFSVIVLVSGAEESRNRHRLSLLLGKFKRECIL